jgi:single-strand DNA-binding protein
MHFCKGAIAINESFRKRDGTFEQQTTFLNYRIWGKNGITFAGNFQKGSRVYIEGSLKSDQWEDAQGNKRTQIVIHVFNFGGLVSLRKVEEFNRADASFGSLSADDVTSETERGLLEGEPQPNFGAPCEPDDDGRHGPF